MPKPRPNAWRRARQVSQAAFFALFLYSLWSTKYPLQGFINPEEFFQLDPLVMLVTSLAERLLIPGLAWTFLTLIVTLVFGRVFCGWFCPLGTLQDLVGRLTARYRRREPEPSPRLRSKLVLLSGLVLLAAGGIQWVWAFDPLAIFVRALSFQVLPGVNAGADRAAAWLLPVVDYWPPLDQGYAWLKANLLDVGNPVFPHAAVIGWVLLGILAGVLVRRRFWCRYLCPLGALLGLVSRFALLKRDAAACTLACGQCRNVCRTNAISTDARSRPEECVVCLDCVSVCSGEKTRFTFFPGRRGAAPAAPPAISAGPTVSRSQFLVLLAGTTAAAAGCRTRSASTGGTSAVLRPPAALPEAEFVQRCVRCGNCMKVCLTNVLQPAVLESGWAGIWTPRLVPELGYCEHLCTLCGQVCPTGAIPSLSVEQKRRTRIGLAVIDQEVCIPWISDHECLVCEEHCPVSRKAIQVLNFRTPAGKRIGRPVVDPSRCVGCAICENKCPARPRAITVVPLA